MMDWPRLSVAAVALLASASPASAQQAATPTFGPIGPCPATVGIKNGDFEGGELAPWTTIASSASATPGLSAPAIVAGGYESKHALQVKFPAADSIGWYVGQQMGQQCEGATYAVSFAVNWIRFALHGEPDDHSNFCTIGLAPSYCDEPDASPGYYNASTKSGWTVYKYTCKSRKTAWANLNVNVQCIANYTLPPFTMKLDDVSVELAKDQSAAPTTVSSAAGSSSASAATTATGAQASTSANSPSSTPPVGTGAAGKLQPSISACGLTTLYFLLATVLYRLLVIG